MTAAKVLVLVLAFGWTIGSAIGSWLRRRRLHSEEQHRLTRSYLRAKQHRQFNEGRGE